VGLISPSLWFGISCLLLIVGGVILWWIQEEFEPTVQRNMLWRPYPACRIVGWSFVTFFILFALFGLTNAIISGSGSSRRRGTSIRAKSNLRRCCRQGAK
jgi:hypothetical protein